MLLLRGRTVRAISFDIQGTLLYHRAPIEDVYAKLAVSFLRDAPSSAEFRIAFRTSYADTMRRFPNYRKPRDADVYGTRRWWRELCATVLLATGRRNTIDEVDVFFRAVWQHYGSTSGYALFPDVIPTLEYFQPRVILGVTSNCSTRTIDTTLPNLELHTRLRFFSCSQEAGFEKPSPEIYAHTLRKIKHFLPNIEASEVLHVGSNPDQDYFAARDAGLLALHLNRHTHTAADLSPSTPIPPRVIPREDIIDSLTALQSLLILK
jgi:putative hydrolase of the HAD superfamily